MNDDEADTAENFSRACFETAQELGIHPAVALPAFAVCAAHIIRNNTKNDDPKLKRKALAKIFQIMKDVALRAPGPNDGDESINFEGVADKLH